MRRQMNLYLVLAIALGAVSGVSDVRIAQSTTARVVAVNEVSVQREAPLAARRSPAGSPTNGQRPTANGQRIVESPLTGAATPRAPALT
jgi:hypothetical protein